MNGSAQTSGAPATPSVPASPIRDRAYWTAVIHNAAKVTPDDPRYPASRQVAQAAIQGLQDLADTAGEKDIKDISPGKLGTAAVSFGHGASLGLAGDPTYLALARQANPKTAYASDIAGTAALAGIASPAVAGLSPVTQGVILGGGLGAARGAIEPLPGMSRGESAALMGLGGAVTGAVVSKFASKFVPAVRTIWTNVAGMLGKSASPEDIAAITEGAIRSQLGKLKVKPEVIDQAVAAWKANGTLSVRGNPEPVAVRPGETITQTSPKGFAVTGARATPPPPTTPTIAEMMGGPPVAPAGATPYDQSAAARAAYHLAGAAGQDATAAASRAAGTYSTFDPRQALLLALLLGQRPSQ